LPVVQSCAHSSARSCQARTAAAAASAPASLASVDEIQVFSAASMRAAFPHTADSAYPFAMALPNGYALSAVCGNAALMEAAEKTWISSTLASEAGALAAAAAVLAWHERAELCAQLWTTGR